MAHPSNVRDYIILIKAVDEQEAERLLQEIADFFYNLGLEDGSCLDKLCTGGS